MLMPSAKPDMRARYPLTGVSACLSPAPHLKLIEICEVEDGVPSDLAKDGVLAIQLLCRVQCDEELAAVAVWHNCLTTRLTSTCKQAPVHRHVLFTNLTYAFV